MSLPQGAYGRKGIKQALLAGPYSRPSAPPKPPPDGLPSTVGIPIQRSTTAASRKFKLQEKKASFASRFEFWKKRTVVLAFKPSVCRGLSDGKAIAQSAFRRLGRLWDLLILLPLDPADIDLLTLWGGRCLELCLQTPDAMFPMDSMHFSLFWFFSQQFQRISYFSGRRRSPKPDLVMTPGSRRHRAMIRQQASDHVDRSHSALPTDITHASLVPTPLLPVNAVEGICVSHVNISGGGVGDERVHCQSLSGPSDERVERSHLAPLPDPTHVTPVPTPLLPLFAVEGTCASSANVSTSEAEIVRAPAPVQHVECSHSTSPMVSTHPSPVPTPSFPIIAMEGTRVSDVKVSVGGVVEERAPVQSVDSVNWNLESILHPLDQFELDRMMAEQYAPLRSLTLCPAAECSHSTSPMVSTHPSPVPTPSLPIIAMEGTCVSDVKVTVDEVVEERAPVCSLKKKCHRGRRSQGSRSKRRRRARVIVAKGSVEGRSLH
jgi:hypothetical protein